MKVWIILIALKDTPFTAYVPREFKTKKACEDFKAKEVSVSNGAGTKKDVMYYFCQKVGK